MTDDKTPTGEEPVIDFGKKKKKNKEKKEKKEEEEVEMVETEFEEGIVFTYDELLDRLHDIIEAKNQNLATRDKLTVKPPQITRVGAKKTGWANFGDICNTLKRTPEHLSVYVFAELACDGTFAGENNQQFILKGRFYARNIESLLRKYIREYVMCPMCRSTDTALNKDQASRLHYLNCNNCGAFRSTASIKSGFHATGKGERRKARTKASGAGQIVG